MSPTGVTQKSVLNLLGFFDRTGISLSGPSSTSATSVTNLNSASSTLSSSSTLPTLPNPDSALTITQASNPYTVDSNPPSSTLPTTSTSTSSTASSSTTVANVDAAVVSKNHILPIVITTSIIISVPLMALFGIYFCHRRRKSEKSKAKLSLALTRTSEIRGRGRGHGHGPGIGRGRRYDFRINPRTTFQSSSSSQSHKVVDHPLRGTGDLPSLSSTSSLAGLLAHSSIGIVKRPMHPEAGFSACNENEAAPLDHASGFRVGADHQSHHHEHHVQQVSASLMMSEENNKENDGGIIIMPNRILNLGPSQPAPAPAPALPSTSTTSLAEQFEALQERLRRVEDNMNLERNLVLREEIVPPPHYTPTAAATSSSNDIS